MTDRRFTSIDDEIQMLARLTGASNAFVQQVRALFTSKAIALEEDIAPFQVALEEAFRREEAIRAYSGRAQKSMTAVRETLERTRELHRASAERLDEAKAALERNARRLRESGARLDSAAWTLSPGRRPVRDTDAAPIVPGPKEIQ